MPAPAFRTPRQLRLPATVALLAGCALARCLAGDPTPPPAASTPAAAAPAPARAPEAVLQRLSELVHAGRYAEARQLAQALQVAYPGDERLAKAADFLSHTNAEPAPAPATPPPPAAPADPAAALTGMDRVDYNALLELAREAQRETDRDHQRQLLQDYQTRSGAFLARHPELSLLWQLRAAAALGLDDPLTGCEAGQKLLAAGGADSADPAMQRILAQLRNKGWLDSAEARAEAAKRRLTERYAPYRWLEGTWQITWLWYGFRGQNNVAERERISFSGDGFEAHVIGGHAGPDGGPTHLRAHLDDEDHLVWEVFLPPDDPQGRYVFRWRGHLSSDYGTDPRKVSRPGEKYYPTLWQPAIDVAYLEGHDEFYLLLPCQHEDPKSAIPTKYPVRFKLSRLGGDAAATPH